MALGETPGGLTHAKERWWGGRLASFEASVGSPGTTWPTLNCRTMFRRRIRQNPDALHVGHVLHGLG